MSLSVQTNTAAGLGPKSPGAGPGAGGAPLSPMQASKASSETQVSSEADEKIQRGKEDRAGVQKKTFTKWINSYLEKIGLKVDELNNDLRDGIKLLKLLEILSGDKQAKPDRGSARLVKVNNINKALAYLK